MFNPYKQKKFQQVQDVKDSALEHISDDKAFAKAEQLIQNNAVNLDNFKGEEGYDDLEIEQDKQEVERLEEKFRQEETETEFEQRKLATILEAIVYEQGEQSNWFGSDGGTVKTSKYDDDINGVDIVVESIFNHDNAEVDHLGLAIDATSAKRSEVIEKKIDHIKKAIERGELSQVKYFHSENSGLKQKLKNLPRVIVIADADTIKETAELWLKDDHESKQALAKHWVQFQFLEQIESQLGAFEAYAKYVNQYNIARVYEKSRAIIKKIITTKEEALKMDGEDAERKADERDKLHHNFDQRIAKLRYEHE